MMQCPNPKCKSGDLVIDTEVSARVFLSPDPEDTGNYYVWDISYGDHEWTDDEDCECLDCHFVGKVKAFEKETTDGQ